MSLFHMYHYLIFLYYPFYLLSSLLVCDPIIIILINDDTHTTVYFLFCVRTDLLYLDAAPRLFSTFTSILLLSSRRPLLLVGVSLFLSLLLSLPLLH